MRRLEGKVMNDVWFTPEGYQRTSKKLQRRCLELLLSFGKVSGRILDVGCGTGNSLLFIPLHDIDEYLGVDISSDMIGFAKNKHCAKNINFAIGDFLDYDFANKKLFDTVVCAACLHWFAPFESKAIDKISNKLQPGGSLFLSCAFKFELCPGEGDIQNAVLLKIRNKYKTIAPPVVFDDFRFDNSKLLGVTRDFDLIKIHRIEENVSFDNYEDFRDWHLGSGSVIYNQFDEKSREIAVQEYYHDLYNKFQVGEYVMSYSTALMLLRKKISSCIQA